MISMQNSPEFAVTIVRRYETDDFAAAVLAVCNQIALQSVRLLVAYGRYYADIHGTD
jgi:hypothetical protein